MEILRERKVYQRRKLPKGYERANVLHPDEGANVVAALRVLQKRHGSLMALATAMRLSERYLSKSLETRYRPMAGVALRVARLVGVPMESILDGSWARAETCPACGEPRNTR